MPKTLKVTLVKSIIGLSPKQEGTVKALGLRHIRQMVEHEDNPTVRGMNPLQSPARSTNPNGYPVPGNSGRVMSPDPAKRLPADEDDVTIVADQREKTRPPGQLGGKNSEDSIDVALSELEHES